MSQKKNVSKKSNETKKKNITLKKIDDSSRKEVDSKKKEEFEKTQPIKVKKGVDSSNKNLKKKLPKYIPIVGISLVVFIGILVILHFVLFPHIYLKNGNKITVQYMDVYKESGYEANRFGKNLTEEVKISGEVDTQKLGKYKVTYKVGKGIFSRKVVRTVEVVDTVEPELEIEDGDIYVCPGSKYEKENVKVKAYDNYDGDLTKKVKVSIKKDMVTYSVKDSQGNKKSVTRKIFYEDRESPTITLEGSSSLDVCVNTVFKEPGYKAIDNCDLDLTSKVEVEGSIDNSLIGDYDLTYKVTDKAGNLGTASRTVHVRNTDSLGVVYLTFDDGPNEGTTNVILDILKEEGVEATFFVTNKGPDDLIVREYEEGHTVALHTSSHDYAKIYASSDAFFADLEGVSNRVENLTGVHSTFIRFPGGASNTISRRYSSGIMSRLTKEVQDRGYKYYDWNISSGDSGETTDPKKVYSNVVNSLRKDRVNMVLMHDTKSHTRDAIRDIIHYCKENGYTMKKIDGCTTMITQRVNN